MWQRGLERQMPMGRLIVFYDGMTRGSYAVAAVFSVSELVWCRPV